MLLHHGRSTRPLPRRGFRRACIRAGAALLALVVSASAQDNLPDDLPWLDVPRVIGAAPVIDGVLSDSAWSAAAVVDSFGFPWWESGARPQTTARLTWDALALYVAFDARDPNVSALQSQRDDPVSRDDCVEVFFAPNPADVSIYFNFEINALGTVLDRSPRDGRSSAWNAEGLRVAIAVAGTRNDTSDVDTGWTAEIAIPFADIAPYAAHLPPLPGDIWRLNLYRIEDNSNRQHMTWSDTQTPRPQFHVPERFGVVRFTGAPAAP